MMTAAISRTTWLGLALVLLAGNAWSKGNTTPLSEIIAAQSRYPLKIRSMEAWFHAENRLSPGEQSVIQRDLTRRSHGRRGHLDAVQRWQTFYAFKGSKFFCRQKPDTAGVPEPPALLYDGNSTYLVTYRRSPSTGKDTRAGAARVPGKDRPPAHVLSFGYQLESSDHQWIGDLLQQGSYRVTGTSQDPKFGTLYRVQGSQGRDDWALWFAPRFGFLAVRAEERPRGRPGFRAVYRVLGLKQQEGLWFAQSAVRELFHVPANTLATRYTIRVRDIKLNAAPDSLFDARLTVGNTLYDEQTNVAYVVGPSGQKIVDPRYEATKRKPAQLAVAWLFMGSLTSLLMLGVGAVVGWQRRRGSA